jgi:TRAP-type C4-dicarboxylate transport system permease small subunit
MNGLAKWSARLTRVAEFLVILSFVAMGIAIMTQISLRALGHTFLFMEDIAFFGFFWLVFSGVAVAFRLRSHVTVDFVFDRLPPRVRLLAELFAQGVVLFFLALFTWSGVRLTIDNVHQFAMQLRISMVYIYAILPLGGFISLVIVLKYFWDDLEAFLGKESACKE